MFSACDMSVDEIEKSICNVAGMFPPLLAVYLFGSVCTNRHGPLSDIDVAILLNKSETANAVFGDVQDALCRNLKTDNIDLIWLEKAPSALAYRIIRDGRCIYLRDKIAVENFESKTVMKYLDFKPVLNRAYQISKARTLAVT